MQGLKIYNGKIITPGGIINNGSVLITGDTITAVNENNIDEENVIAIDAKGLYVSPGFIDIHVHGGGGHDFMDNSVEAFLAIAETHARYGTTAMWPTSLTSNKEGILKTLDTYEAAKDKNYIDPYTGRKPSEEGIAFAKNAITLFKSEIAIKKNKIILQAL